MAPRVRELRVAARLKNLGAIADFTEECCQRWDISQDDAFSIQLAIDEAATNIIQHAYEGGNGEVRIRCWIKDNDFCVQLVDQGAQFDPDQVPLPVTTGTLEARQTGGLGVYFMRKVMDIVQFEFDEHGNKLLMVKRDVVP